MMLVHAVTVLRTVLWSESEERGYNWACRSEDLQLGELITRKWTNYGPSIKSSTKAEGEQPAR